MVQRYSSPIAQALGDTLNNVGGMMLNQPTQAELDAQALENDYYRARSEQARAGAAVDQAKMAAPGKLAEMIAGMYKTSEGPRPTPDFVGPGAPVSKFDFSRSAELTPLAVAAGVDPRQVLDSVTRSGMLADPTNPLASTMLNILGDDYGKTQAGFGATLAETARENDMESGDRRYASDNTLTGTRYTADKGFEGKVYDVDTTDKRNRDLFMPTLAQAQGAEFTNIANAGGFTDPNEVPPAGSVAARLLGGSNAAQATARNWITVDGKAMGQTLDGVTDAQTGEPLPDTAMIANEKDLDPSGTSLSVDPASGAVTFTQGNATTEIPKQTQASLLGEAQAFEDYGVLSNRAREVAMADPTLFGAVGNLRRFGQGAAGQVKALSQAFGGDAEFNQGFDNAVAGLTNMGFRDPRIFDPNLSEIEKLSTLMAYSAASAIGGQDGRGLSNEDRQYFQQIVGDPTGWLSSQDSFVAGLNMLDRIVGARRSRVKDNLSGEFNLDGAAPPAAAPAAAPAGVPQPLTDRAPNLDFSPSRQQYRDRTTGEMFDINGNPVQ